MQTYKLLSDEEQKVVDLLAQAWEEYMALPVLHTWDQRDFASAMRQAEFLVFSRPTRGEGGLG